jgi:uncharacterized membrane protein
MEELVYNPDFLKLQLANYIKTVSPWYEKSDITEKYLSIWLFSDTKESFVEYIKKVLRKEKLKRILNNEM